MGRSSGGAGHSSGGTSGRSHSSGGFSGGGRSSGGGMSHSSRDGGPSRSSGINHRSSMGMGGPSMHHGPRTNMHHRPGPGMPPPPRRHSTYGPRPYRGGYGNSGCGSFLALLILIIIIFAIVYAENGHSIGKSFMGSSSSSLTLTSTKSRKPLTGVAKKTDYYSDQIGWITDKKTLQDGLQDFYNATGVQPYILLIKYSSVYWPNGSLDTTSADSYLEEVYEQKFSDEGHIILAYFQCDDDSKNEMDGEFRYLLGYSAQIVMDDEAVNILLGYLEAYYYDTSLSIEKMISQAFSDTANSIMSGASGNELKKKSSGAKNVFFIIIIVGIAGGGYYFYKAKKNNNTSDSSDSHDLSGN